MPTMYARCSNFMSGATSGVGVNCKALILGESEDEVLQRVFEHLETIHPDKVEDARELENTIRRCIFTKGTKTIHNRGPDREYNHS